MVLILPALVDQFFDRNAAECIAFAEFKNAFHCFGRCHAQPRRFGFSFDQLFQRHLNDRFGRTQMRDSAEKFLSTSSETDRHVLEANTFGASGEGRSCGE